MRSSSPSIYLPRILGFVALSMSLASLAHGQGPNGNPQSLQSREWVLTHISEEVNQHFPATSGNSQLPQVQADFHQLQVVNNNLMRRVFIDMAGDPKQISAAMAEIKKRATHLRDRLELPSTAGQQAEPAIDSKSTPDPAPLSTELLALDRAVMAFVHNPLFHQPKVLDAGLALKASQDLSEVLRLADVVQQLAVHPSRLSSP